MAPEPLRIEKMTEHLFRETYQEVFSSLLIKFGTAHVDLIEDALQEAFLKALQSWKHNQLPQNPKGWLFTVAKNHIFNQLKRNMRSIPITEKDLKDIYIEDRSEKKAEVSQLYVLLSCANVALRDSEKIIFTLKSICGFGVSEIANGLLLTEDNVYKQLQRCKTKLKRVPKTYFQDLNSNGLKKADVQYLIDIIYFMFNEGYDTTNTNATTPINKEICFEAVRLGLLLAKHSKEESIRHMVALFYFHMARFDSRTDSEGAFISLRHQDRSTWDTNLIATGFEYLVKPSRLNHLYIEALIASQHCLAKSFEKTEWPKVLRLYDLLLKINDTAVIRMNRAICLFEMGRQVEGSKELLRIKKSLGNNYIYYSVSMAEYLEDKDPELSKIWYKKSLEKTKQDFRKKLIKNKLSKLDQL